MNRFHDGETQQVYDARNNERNEKKRSPKKNSGRIKILFLVCHPVIEKLAN